MNAMSGPSAARVGAVIPAHRGGGSLLDALTSLRNGTLVPEWIVVVDNASGDGSIERASVLFPHVEFIRNARNLGFGKACNQGIELMLERGAEFVFLLNQDAQVEPGTLTSLVCLALAHHRAAAIGPKTLSKAAQVGAAPIILYNGAFRTVFALWQRLPGVGWPHDPKDSGRWKVDYAWGHALLLRSTALREVGLFDPRYFMYYEDIDLCDRLRRAGWEVWCDGREVAWHAIGDSARANASEAWRWELKQSSARLFYRSRYHSLPADLLWIGTAAREIASLLRHGHGTAACHLLRAVYRVVRSEPIEEIASDNGAMRVDL